MKRMRIRGDSIVDEGDLYFNDNKEEEYIVRKRYPEAECVRNLKHTFSILSYSGDILGNGFNASDAWKNAANNIIIEYID